MGERGTMLQREIIKRKGEREGTGDIFEKYIDSYSDLFWGFLKI